MSGSAGPKVYSIDEGGVGSALSWSFSNTRVRTPSTTSEEVAPVTILPRVGWTCLGVKPTNLLPPSPSGTAMEPAHNESSTSFSVGGRPSCAKVETVFNPAAVAPPEIALTMRGTAKPPIFPKAIPPRAPTHAVMAPLFHVYSQLFKYDTGDLFAISALIVISVMTATPAPIAALPVVTRATAARVASFPSLSILSIDYSSNRHKD